MILCVMVVGLTFSELGLVAAVIAAIVAFVPAMIYLLPFMFLDHRYDPEPFWLFGSGFWLGSRVAVFVSFIVNTVITILVAVAANVAGYSPQIWANMRALSISAPIFEEGSKGSAF